MRMNLKESEVAKTVYAVVTDTLLTAELEPVGYRCVVKTLWSNKKDAEEYARENGLRVVPWGILRKVRKTNGENEYPKG